MPDTHWASRHMVLTYFDLLGVRSRWHAGGREAAEKAFKDLEQLLHLALQKEGITKVAGGGLETDAATILFDDATTAFRFSRRLFQDAFARGAHEGEERLWLRGVIIPAHFTAPLRKGEAISSQFTNLEVFRLADPLLEAISIEKSGVKGMRIIIDSNIVTPELKNQFRVQFKNDRFLPFRKLNHSSYPGRVSAGFQDFLWMVESMKEWEGVRRTMATRLRRASDNPEEFLQAAATQVVFHECAAIVASL